MSALREGRRGRVSVELDGSRWRVLPLEVVVRTGLREGDVLDRPRLRLLRRELRRAEALAVATRALAARDLSMRGLADRLERAGVPAPTREASLDALERAGLVDDERFARRRAETLAARGYGDAAIRFDLERQGVAGAVIAAACEALESEAERAVRLVERLGAGPRAARRLAARGFSEDAVEAALSGAFANRP